MLKHWKKLSSMLLYENPWWSYKLDHFQIPHGVSGEYHYVYTRGSSMVIPLTGEGKIILVKQYRYLADRESVEFPCGSVKAGDTHLKTAQLELKEETGFSAKNLDVVGEFNPYNGVTCETCNVYLAINLETCISERDETEEFEILHLAPEELDSMIHDKMIWDGMTLAAWMLSRSTILENVS